MDKDFLALWGAILSTILLLIKIYEMWIGRFRLDIYLSIDGPHEEKEVVITNLASKAIHIKSFELYWAKHWLSKRKQFVTKDYDLYNNLHVGAYAVKTLMFKEHHHFALKQGNRLYIRLNIAGKFYKKTMKIF